MSERENPLKQILSRWKAQIFWRLPCAPDLGRLSGRREGGQSQARQYQFQQDSCPPHIAVLYPWDDILERRSGASRRTGHLVDLLQLSGFGVAVYSVGGRLNRWQNNVQYKFYCPKFPQADLVRQAYQDAFQTWQALAASPASALDADPTAHWLPWQYYPWRYDPSFQQWLETITDWADAIVLEYPFWAHSLAPLCRQKQIPWLITAHDVLAKQLPEQSLQAQIALTEEVNALRQADQVITLTTADQTFFEQQGITNFAVPIGLDLQHLNQVEQQIDAPHACLAQAFPAKNWHRPFGLFVGSDFLPNQRAAARLQAMAAHRPDWDLVVAGGCTATRQEANFYGLGKVSEQVLNSLYLAAAVVVIPLEAGTGMSLKTLEALALGKVVLGTAIAFRGYPIESGKQGIIEDQLSAYPDRLDQIIADPERFHPMAQAAKAFAQGYDYRTLYQPYLDWISTALGQDRKGLLV